MKVLIKAIGIAVTAVALTGAARMDTGVQRLLIHSSDATARVEADTSIGRYYTLTYQLPAGLQSGRLERAILELYVDVSVKVREEHLNEAPVLEVYALRAPYAGAFEAKDLDEGTRVVRPVTLGENRRVLFDITKIVRAYLTGTTGNNGLIVGSLTGMREGDFRLVPGKLAADAVGQIRIYLRPANDR